MEGLPGGTLMAIIIMTVLLLLLGSVLDGLALMLLTTPILLPIVTDLGLSPIWFGIYLVRTMEIGFVHPPIGINLYVFKASPRTCRWVASSRASCRSWRPTCYICRC